MAAINQTFSVGAFSLHAVVLDSQVIINGQNPTKKGLVVVPEEVTREDN